MSTRTGDAQERRELAARLRGEGLSWTDVAGEVHRRFRVNIRVALRMARGWSQREAADRWNQLWPDDRKTAKNFSYWEMWPATTGYMPSLDVLDKLAQLYECHVADLLADCGDYSLPQPGRTAAVRLADLAPYRIDKPAGEWRTASLKAVLRLDRPHPEFVEQRVIEVVSGDVHELDTDVSLPRHPDDNSPSHGLRLELDYGGRLTAREQPTESHFRAVIALPAPLRAGDRHEYQMRYRLPTGQPLSPRCVHIPLRASGAFELRVRFDPAVLPARIWRVEHAPPTSVGDLPRDPVLLRPDRFGEVHVEYTDLRQGHAYGVCWS